MNDLKFAFRQLLKNPGFTVHPPQWRLPDRSQFPPRRGSRKLNHAPQQSYGGRALAVLMLGIGIGANTAIFNLVNAVVLALTSSPAGPGCSRR